MPLAFFFCYGSARLLPRAARAGLGVVDTRWRIDTVLRLLDQRLGQRLGDRLFCVAHSLDVD